MLPNRPRSSGFTLIELLVSISVLGILVALLLPAVQMARESARRTVCKNQLRQMGIALHNYHDTHLSFPSGSYVMGPSFPTQSGWGWGAMILPYIDQGPLYQQLDFKLGTAVGSNLPIIGRSLPIWRCPTDTGPTRLTIQSLDHGEYDLASGNYVGSGGILSEMSSSKMHDIVDGPSNTFLLGERLVQVGQNNTLPFTSAWCGHVAFADAVEYRSVPHLTATRNHLINASESDALCFGSRHSGSAHFVFADGSARLLSQYIDADLFEALGTANGGEAVTAPE